jgi:hypothetical protein
LCRDLGIEYAILARTRELTGLPFVVSDIKPAAQIVEDLIREAAAALAGPTTS